MTEAHDGRFAGHFTERRIYEQLRKYYWWDNMRADVLHYCGALKPQLQSIPIGGPFHRVGIDVLLVT